MFVRHFIGLLVCLLAGNNAGLLNKVIFFGKY